MKIFIFIILYFFSTSLYANTWKEHAEKDLHFIYKTIKTQHPGSIDSENKYFLKHLESGFDQAKKELGLIKDENDYKAILSKYITGFEDGHLACSYNKMTENQTWSEFLLKYENSKFKVAHSEYNSVKAGYELLSCDNKTPTEIMLNEVIPFQYGIKRLESSWIALTPHLLQKWPHYNKNTYSNCLFFDGNKNILVKLKYKTIPTQEYIKKVSNILVTKTDGFKIRSVDNNTAWVHLPTFDINQKEAPALNKMIDDLSKFSNKKYIVFDLRTNTGGNSNWGDKILNKLYGSSTKASENQSEGYALWRATPENLLYIKEIVTDLEKKFGKDSFYYTFYGTQKNMEIALKNKVPFAKQENYREIKETEIKKPAPTTHAIPIVLTDVFCASACLDFLDQALTIKNVIHIGQPTSADTNYMDIRTVDLPSKNGKLRFAMKVYRNRDRGHLQNYNPHYRFNGNITNTKELEEWILNEVTKSYTN